MKQTTRNIVPAPKKNHKRYTRKGKITPGIQFLRSVAFPDVYGTETEYGIYPSYTQQDYVARCNAGWWKRRLPNYAFHDHFQAKHTFFYFGNGRLDAPFTLVKIDIDVLKSKGRGSAAGALAFLAHLRKRWPKLYAETSRSGHGQNAWLLLRKPGLTARDVNRALKKFAGWLRSEAVGFDVEGVEVKGHCPEFSYNRFGSVEAVKYGTFARYPRDADACAKSQVVSASELTGLEPREIPAIASPVEAHPSGWIIHDEDLDRLPGLESAFAGIDLKAGRVRVTAEDWAMFALLVDVLPENKDGQQPYRRYEVVWNELYQAGKVKRAFNYHRFKAMRDYLSQRGHVHWLDNRYCPNSGDRRGIACKWRVSGELRPALLDINVMEQDQRKASMLKPVLRKRGPHAHMTPELAPLHSIEEAHWRETSEKRLEMLFAA